jgi:5-methylcytosine-specific restriction endonuclease McrA
MPALCPWPLDSFTYDGCCTHFSINEGIPGHAEDGTPEEINRVDSERKLVKRVKAGGVSKRYGDKAEEEQRYKCTVCDLTFRSKAALLDHEKRPIHIRKAAGIPKVLARRGRQRNSAVTNKKFWCEPCKHAAPTAAKLETHLKGPRHAKKLRDLASSSKLD